MSNYEQENKINFAFTQNLEHNKMNKISPLFQVNKDKEIEKEPIWIMPHLKHNFNWKKNK